MTPRRSLWICALAASVAVGCGSKDQATTTAPQANQSATPEAPAGASAAVPEILQFTTTDLTGAAVDGASYAGKPVAFWFWAPG